MSESAKSPATIYKRFKTWLIRLESELKQSGIDCSSENIREYFDEPSKQLDHVVAANAMQLSPEDFSDLVI